MRRARTSPRSCRSERASKTNGWHTWMFKDGDQNRAEVDAILGAGAYIMGRNMFGHGPGEWDLGWTDSVRSTSSGCTSCPSRSVQASGCSTPSPG